MQEDLEVQFIDRCLLQMESADPVERAFGKLQRDCVLALNQVATPGLKPADLLMIVGNVISALAVNGAVRASLPGNEQRVLQHVMDMAGEIGRQHLEAYLEAAGARGQVGSQAGRMSGAQVKE